ncbi:class I SAM-dependent methyltransferase [Streptomyces sp. PTY087I2]|uniref:class I SAM-dependent methyltransferase n=1 Tax=Streptomyces sp. PTY087I2 TaxID=1819298 RepID=UPI00350E4CAA
MARLRALGAGPGWHCLDIGAGTGTVSRRLLGEAGVASVLAVDRDVRFLDARPAPGLRTLQADVTAPDFAPRHLSARARALRSDASARAGPPDRHVRRTPRARRRTGAQRRGRPDERADTDHPVHHGDASIDDAVRCVESDACAALSAGMLTAWGQKTRGPTG